MTEKCKPAPYRYRNYEGLAPLTREVRAITKPILGSRGFAGVDILENWETIIGPDLSQGIKPEKLTFERDNRTNGTLYVKSAGGAFAMLFEHQKSRVIERINSFFGYPTVGHIKIQQGSVRIVPPKITIPKKLTPAQENELKQRVAKIDDPELREQAYRIGQEILLKNQ